MKARLRQTGLGAWRRFNGRVFGWVFVAMMVAVAVYAARQPRVYEARGELEIPRMAPVRDAKALVVEEPAIRSRLDLNTIREVVASQLVLRRVRDRLSADERDGLLRPYGLAGGMDNDIERLILANRTLSMVPKTLRLELRFRHPDRVMAMRIVELFLAESVAVETRSRMDQSAYASQFLAQRAEQVAKQVEASRRELVAYRQSRPELDSDVLGADESYQALIKKAASEAEMHRMILERLSEANAEDSGASAWRISRAPAVPGEADYLRGPIMRTLGLGTALAVVVAALAAWVFKRQETGINQQEDL